VCRVWPTLADSESSESANGLDKLTDKVPNHSPSQRRHHHLYFLIFFIFLAMIPDFEHDFVPLDEDNLADDIAGSRPTSAQTKKSSKKQKSSKRKRPVEEPSSSTPPTTTTTPPSNKTKKKSSSKQPLTTEQVVKTRISSIHPLHYKPRSFDTLLEAANAFSKSKKIKVVPGRPWVIVLASGAVRCCALLKQLAPLRLEIAKLFAKHMKMTQQRQQLEQRPVKIAVGTPQRVAALLEEGALSLADLRCIIFDAHLDAKNFSVLNAMGGIGEAAVGVWNQCTEDALGEFFTVVV
jgi:superfamily II DNA/RNA helicase